MSGSYIVTSGRCPNAFRVSRREALSKMIDSDDNVINVQLATSAAPNEDWIWVSIVDSAVLRRRNT